MLAHNQEEKQTIGKPNILLVPVDIITAIARVREYGNEKYKDSESWKRVPSQEYINAIWRHLIAMEDNIFAKDEESGLYHLWHIACNVAFLCFNINR